MISPPSAPVGARFVQAPIPFTGLELGRVAFGQSPATPGGFSGLISDQLIASAEITCTFNADLKCGVYDIQFGTLAPVPVPAAVWLFGTALIGLAGIGKRRKAVHLSIKN